MCSLHKHKGNLVRNESITCNPASRDNEFHAVDVLGLAQEGRSSNLEFPFWHINERTVLTT